MFLTKLFLTAWWPLKGPADYAGMPVSVSIFVRLHYNKEESANTQTEWHPDTKCICWMKATGQKWILWEREAIMSLNVQAHINSLISSSTCTSAQTHVEIHFAGRWAHLDL